MKPSRPRLLTCPRWRTTRPSGSNTAWYLDGIDALSRISAARVFDADASAHVQRAFTSFHFRSVTSRPVAPAYRSYTFSISGIESKKPTMNAALNDSPGLIG